MPYKLTTPQSKQAMIRQQVDIDQIHILTFTVNTPPDADPSISAQWGLGYTDGGGKLQIVEAGGATITGKVVLAAMKKSVSGTLYDVVKTALYKLLIREGHLEKEGAIQ